MTKKTILASVFAATALLGGVTVTSLMTASPVAAQSSSAKEIVDQAKASGIIGETAGGYLKVVSSADRDVVNAMNEINIRRKTLYTRLAREKNLEIDVVAALTAEKVRASKAKSGEKYLEQSGEWITIP